MDDFRGTVLDNEFYEDLKPIIEEYINTYFRSFELRYLKNHIIENIDFLYKGTKPEIIENINNPIELKEYMKWKCECEEYVKCEYCECITGYCEHRDMRWFNCSDCQREYCAQMSTYYKITGKYKDEELLCDRESR